MGFPEGHERAVQIFVFQFFTGEIIFDPRDSKIIQRSKPNPLEAHMINPLTPWAHVIPLEQKLKKKSKNRQRRMGSAHERLTTFFKTLCHIFVQNFSHLKEWRSLMRF